MPDRIHHSSAELLSEDCWALRRTKPPVGRHEMRSLLKGPSAPDSAQLAAMGSRNALSPRRATAHMRQTLGHAEVTQLAHRVHWVRWVCECHVNCVSSATAAHAVCSG